MMDKIDIILPTHNHLELTIKCVNALYAYTTVPFNLIVVDDSTDLTPQYFKRFCKQHDNVKYIRPKEKITRGNQNLLIGLENTTSEYLVFLANSTTVEPNWLDVALSLIKSDLKIGLVGFKLLYQNGTIEHAGMTLAPDLTPMNYGMHQLGHTFTHIREVPIVGFALILFRREAMAGSIDTETYTGFSIEDLDVCLTMRQKGWKIIYCGMGVAYHIATATRADDRRATAIWLENFERFRKKWTSKN